MKRFLKITFSIFMCMFGLFMFMISNAIAQNSDNWQSFIVVLLYLFMSSILLLTSANLYNEI